MRDGHHLLVDLALWYDTVVDHDRNTVKQVATGAQIARLRVDHWRRAKGEKQGKSQYATHIWPILARRRPEPRSIPESNALGKRQLVLRPLKVR